MHSGHIYSPHILHPKQLIQYSEEQLQQKA